MEEYRLPDGRLPLRFTGRRAAYYKRADGQGEIRYRFSEIKYQQKRKGRPNLTPEQRSEVARQRRDLLVKKNPDFFREIGSTGGKRGKRSANSHTSKEDS